MRYSRFNPFPQVIFQRWIASALFLVLLTLSYRLSFLAYHHDMFIDQTLGQQIFALFWGIRFDLAIALPMALISLSLFYLLRVFVTLPWYNYTLIWAPIIFVVQLGDTLYFQDSGRHISYEILSAQGDALGLIQHALHTGLAFVIISFLMLIVWMGLWLKAASTWSKSVQSNFVQAEPLIRRILTWVVILLCTIIGVRGGISGVPQSPIHAYKIGNAKLAIIASNPTYIAFSILSSGSNGIKQVPIPATQFTSADLKKALYPEQHKATSQAPASQFNIMLIFLESWNAAFMQSYQAEEPLNITPNFDAFRQNSITSDLTLAGGHRTVEGVFASMCSFQNPLGTSIAHSQLLDFPYLCLPEILNQQGYQTTFIQGSYRDTGSVGSFAQRLGFKESLGKAELPVGKIPHNSWGLQDDDLYEIVLNKAEQQLSPFFYAINTTSTHDTVVPESSIPLLDAKTSEEKHKNVMHYADEAFGRFLARFYQSPLAKNTILIVMADHTAQIHSSYLHEYMIPMAIQTPDKQRLHIPHATSQRDLAPTLLEILGLPKPTSFTGKSLLSSQTFFADYYHNQSLGWIEGDTLMSINLLDNKQSCYAWRSDSLMQDPITCQDSPEIYQHALTATSRMQNLLFKGETSTYLK